jgi:hypothetical protein
MKINELIVEQQLDELGIAQGIGKAVGGVAKGIGAVAGGAVGAWDAAKQGYAAGKATVSGQPFPTINGTNTQQSGAGASTLGTQAPQTTGGTPGATANPNAQAPAAGQQPITPQQAQQQQQQALQQQQAADKQAKVGVGQINKIIPSLRTRDLDSIKKQIDLRTQQLNAKKPAVGTPPTGVQTATGTQPAAGQPNLQVQQGGLSNQQAVAENTEFYSKFLGRNL